MDNIFGSLNNKDKEQLMKRSQPHWLDPMLATLTDTYFDHPDWIYERKLDGERSLVFKKGNELRFMSRNKKNITQSYPELSGAFAHTSRNLIADGEIVAFTGNRTSFARLQERMHEKTPSDKLVKRVPVCFYVFDILYLSGHLLTGLSLRSRKSLLKKVLSFEDPIRFMVHRNENGQDYHEQACKKGWEGIIAKDGTSSYVHSRSRKWLKFKCVNRQELVIGGYTEPVGERIGFGAVLVGYHENDQFVFAGRVGTGFDDKTLKEMSETFSSLERKTSPFDRGDPSTGGVHWITPKLVAEIAFTEWTEDGKLRHPRFLGLRRDKKAADVTRERS